MASGREFRGKVISQKKYQSYKIKTRSFGISEFMFGGVGG